MTLVTTLAMATSGCSFLFVRTANDHNPTQQCTESRGAPIADAILVAPEVLFGAAFAGAATDDVRHGDQILGFTAATLFTLAAVQGASAIYGILTTNHCHEVMEAAESSPALHIVPAPPEARPVMWYGQPPPAPAQPPPPMPYGASPTPAPPPPAPAHPPPPPMPYGASPSH